MNRYGKTSFLQLREDAFESLEVVRQSAAEATGTSAASFQDRYLISGWFMGSHLNQGIWGLGVQPGQQVARFLRSLDAPPCHGGVLR